MAPNTVDPPSKPTVINITGIVKDTNVVSSVQISHGKYALKILTSALNILTYLLIGATVGISLLYALSDGLPLSSTPMHIVLCVLGYQLLMTVAILSLLSSSGWSAVMTLRDKRRAHTVLQVIGSCLGVIGSFIKIINKSTNFNTLHGQFGLVALVFTILSLVNGVAALYAFEWRRWLPSNLSKLTHICFGIVVYATASISLGYGFHKRSFRSWATDAYTNTLIIFTAIFTVIVIFNPIVTFFSKSLKIIRK